MSRSLLFENDIVNIIFGASFFPRQMFNPEKAVLINIKRKNIKMQDFQALKKEIVSDYSVFCSVQNLSFLIIEIYSTNLIRNNV